MADFVDIGGVTRAKAEPPDPNNPPKNDNDGFPAIIDDQRHFWAFLGHDVTTTEEIEKLEILWCAGEPPAHPHKPANWPIVQPRDDPELRTVVPRINAGRWIGDCPACGNASALWDARPVMVCLGRGCGLRFKVAWQVPALRSEVIRVIADWPTVNQSWEGHKGETVEELKVQAVLMQGVAPNLRNGLLVASGVSMPDDFVSPQEYLDVMKAQRIKAHQR